MAATVASKQAKARAELIVEGVKKDLQTKYPGYTVKTRCRYDPDGQHLSFTVEMAIVAADGVAHSKEYDDLQEVASMYGWKPEDITKTVTLPGHGKCKLVGYNGRAPRRPWHIQTEKGKTLVGENLHIIMYWKLQIPEWAMA